MDGAPPIPLMNHTKWSELRLAMLELGKDFPAWRNRILESGSVGRWDDDWFHHFYSLSYDDIEWVELEVQSDHQRDLVRAALKQVHVPGEETDFGFRILGYSKPGEYVQYIG